LDKRDKLEDLVEDGDEIVLHEWDFKCECEENKFFCGINGEGYLVLQCPVCYNIRILTKNPQDFLLEAMNLSDEAVIRQEEVKD